MILKSDETDLIGNWLFDGKSMTADPIETRIKGLIDHHLERIADSPESGGWEILYRDPVDGRYWELTYPNGEMQGGGPKRLTNLSAISAVAKYHLQKPNPI